MERYPHPHRGHYISTIYVLSTWLAEVVGLGMEKITSTATNRLPILTAGYRVLGDIYAKSSVPRYSSAVGMRLKRAGILLKQDIRA